jgi:ABC-type transport system involved in cytochrome c biogenesis ATPase subunit
VISFAACESELAVDLRNLTKHFGKVTAVNDLTLRLSSGEIVAFLGPNGAGKTTTIDMLLGLTRPDAGTARIYDRLPSDAIARGEVSAVMQNSGLLKDFTVRETVAYTASLYASARPVNEVLERAGIADIGDRRVQKCSGGEQQRLRFAMALLSDPRLLILDEPTTGHGCSGPARFLVGYSKGRGAGSHCNVCDALSRRSGCLCRSDRTHSAGCRRRGRNDSRNQEPRLGPHLCAQRSLARFPTHSRSFLA